MVKKHQVTNTKYQANFNVQDANSKLYDLGFEVWSLFGAWCLWIGIFAAVHEHGKEAHKIILKILSPKLTSYL